MPPLRILQRIVPGGKKLGLRFAGGHFLFKSLPEPRFYVLRNGLRFETFINLQRLFGSVDDDETIWTFIDVLFQMALHRRIGAGIQIIVQFL